MKNKWLTNKDQALRLLSTSSVSDFLNIYYHETKKEWSGLSYQWLAREMEISKTLVVGIFNGTKKLNSKHVDPLLEALQLPKGVQNYFEYLVALDGKAGSAKMVKNLRETYLDSLDTTLSYDISISDPDFAVLYAALGDQDNGASIEEIMQKIRWPEERIRFLLNELRIKKFVKLHAQERWSGTKKFISTVASSQTDWLPKLFVSTLKRHQELAQKNFFTKDHLSLTYTFCTQQSDFTAMNEDIKKFMNKMMEKYHDGEGGKIVSLIVGTHTN